MDSPELEAFKADYTRMFTSTSRSYSHPHSRSGRFLFAQIALLLCLSAAAPLVAQAKATPEPAPARTASTARAAASLKHNLGHMRRAALFARTSLAALARSAVAQTTAPPEVPPAQKPVPSAPEPTTPPNPTPGATPEVAASATTPEPVIVETATATPVRATDKPAAASARSYHTTDAAYAFTKPLSPALTRAASGAAYACMLLGALLYALSFRRQPSLQIVQPAANTLATS